MGRRDLRVWDNSEPGAGVFRHYYTRGKVGDSFGPEDEVTVVTP